MTETLKFACESSEDTQWIAMLLGREPSTEYIPQVSNKGADLGS